MKSKLRDTPNHSALSSMYAYMVCVCVCMHRALHCMYAIIKFGMFVHMIFVHIFVCAAIFCFFFSFFVVVRFVVVYSYLV